MEEEEEDYYYYYYVKKEACKILKYKELTVHLHLMCNVKTNVTSGIVGTHGSI
jgi:hypothetical protein